LTAADARLPPARLVPQSDQQTVPALLRRRDWLQYWRRL